MITGQAIIVWLAYLWLQAARVANAGSGGRLSLRARLARGWHSVTPTIRGTLLRALVICVAGTSLAATFTGWRVSIPHIQPFGWDARLHAFDLALHGGIPPWEVAHAMWPDALSPLLDWLYSRGCFLANVVLLAVLAVSPSGPRTQRVLVAPALWWLAGDL
jgi:hypothetical protein